MCKSIAGGKARAARINQQGANNPNWKGDKKLCAIDYARKQKEKRPDAYRANRMLYDHVRRGNIVRQPCIVCGNPKSHGHHDDYSKPLSVIWLCREHHKELHERILVRTNRIEHGGMAGHKKRG
jgi:hypothetical protein